MRATMMRAKPCLTSAKPKGKLTINDLDDAFEQTAKAEAGLLKGRF
jgi:hypothetical protein